MKKIRLFKLGWYLGWIGTFSWVYGFTIYFLMANFYVAGISGIIISLLSIISIILTAPWKYPKIKYFLILLPTFLLLATSIFWLIINLQPITGENISPYWVSWLIFIILPVISLGNKTWDDQNIN